MLQSRFITHCNTISKLGGLLLFMLLLLLPPPEGMNILTWRAFALSALMIVWWLSETLPLPVTALLPLIMFPLLNIMPLQDAAIPYAHPIIFLFLGGFIIAIAIEKSRLHMRIALAIVHFIGTRPDRMVAGFMAATAFLSMWISNTATVLMMFPMALSVIALLKEMLQDHSKDGEKNFALCLLLGIAFASSVGGAATLIGTPPNAFAKGFFSTAYGYEISFLDWIQVGLPFNIIMLAVMWVVMTKFLFPLPKADHTLAQKILKEEQAKLGTLSGKEKLTAIIASCAAAGWLLEGKIALLLPGFNEVTVSLIGAMALFVIPFNSQHDRLLTWSDLEKLPWGILILFGGGLSLASGFASAGLADYVAQLFEGAGEHLSHWMLVGIFVFFMSLATSFMSNVAASTLFIPITASIAIGLGENPLLLTLPVTLAASCAFLLPVSCASNAIVFGSSYISIQQMAKAGIIINMIAVVVLTILSLTWLPWVLDAPQGVVPEWAIISETAAP